MTDWLTGSATRYVRDFPAYVFLSEGALLGVVGASGSDFSADGGGECERARFEGVGKEGNEDVLSAIPFVLGVSGWVVILGSVFDLPSILFAT